MRARPLAFVVALSCSDGGIASAPTDGGGAPLDGGNAQADAGAKGLPFAFTRPENGEPLSGEELAAATDVYLELLEGTRYFDFMDERVHGWPESDSQGRYWYGSWWSGVEVHKSDCVVTYLHGDQGADNNGLRTGPMLEGACFAYLVSGDPRHAYLARKLVRGFTSWLLAMESEASGTGIPLLTRAAYPESIASTDGSRDLFIDYSLNRPGLDNGATEYVHLPDNPHWGDLWVKNKRSKDDIGHMLRAIGACAGALADAGAGAAADYDDMRERYGAWARQVEDDGWRIATYAKDGELWYPDDLLAWFTDVGNAECDGMLAIRLLGRGEQGDLDCGNGVGALDAVLSEGNGSNGEIL
ncbi:MAG: hypothetical protein AABZ30_08510, partial [Myxococcota bacterium]